MSQFTHEVRNGIAWVAFDSGAMNTLSAAAVTDLNALRATLQRLHASTPLKGVILKGNRFGLGAGANIGELMTASRVELGKFIDAGHEALYAIEEGPVPWLALIDGVALGGIYELALGCRGIIATERSTIPGGPVAACVKASVTAGGTADRRVQSSAARWAPLRPSPWDIE